MKISQLYPKRYASGEDFAGKPVTLTIRAVVMEEMRPPGAPAEEKPVAYFERTTKGIILTRALAHQIADILGDDTDQWTGKRITLYPQPMKVAGQDRIAIRARPAANGPSTPPPSLQEEEDEL